MAHHEDWFYDGLKFYFGPYPAFMPKSRAQLEAEEVERHKRRQKIDADLREWHRAHERFPSETELLVAAQRRLLASQSLTPRQKAVTISSHTPSRETER